MGYNAGGSRAADYMKHLTSYYHKKTAPLTVRYIGRGRSFLEDESQVFDNPLYKNLAQQNIWSQPIYNQALDPSKRVIESQFQRAREDALANMPAGGQLYGTLADIQGERAQSLGDLEKELQIQDILRREDLELEKQRSMNNLAQSLYADEMARTYGLATMTPTQGIGSLGAAAAAQAQTAAAQSSGKLGAAGQLGRGIGDIIGASIAAGPK